MKIEKLIHDTCPVCGGIRIGHPSMIRIGHPSVKLMICHRNERCPVRYCPIPKGIKTGIEAMTYAKWIPDKDANGNTVYFNPRFDWVRRYHEAMRRDCKCKYLEVHVG